MSDDITSRSPEDTQRIGKKLGEMAKPGDVFLLVGDLGTGKTCFAQGVAWGLGIEGYASSPSFILVREYRGRLPLYHIDLYRLNRIEEVMELGLDGYIYGGGVCVVEWAERGLSALPPEHLLIKFSYISEMERCLGLDPKGRRYSGLAYKLCHSL